MIKFRVSPETTILVLGMANLSVTRGGMSCKKRRARELQELRLLNSDFR